MAEQGLEDPRDAEVLPWTFKVSVLWMQLISVENRETVKARSAGFLEV